MLVALDGLGSMLIYKGCGDSSCLPAAEVHSNASYARGKGGMDVIDDMLCLVVGSEPVFSEGALGGDLKRRRL